MEDKYPVKEIKVMEGVYIWKPEKKSNNNDSNNDPNKKQQQNYDNKNIEFIGNKSSIGENEYLCHGKDELIKIYEIEFEELGNRVLALFQSNEDMMEFDPNDYDLIQAREENLELIDKKLAEIIKIQKKMKEICSFHPIVEVDIFEYFGIGKSTLKSKEEKEENKNNINFIFKTPKKSRGVISKINSLTYHTVNYSPEYSYNNNKTLKFCLSNSKPENLKKTFIINKNSKKSSLINTQMNTINLNNEKLKILNFINSHRKKIYKY